MEVRLNEEILVMKGRKMGVCSVVIFEQCIKVLREPKKRSKFAVVNKNEPDLAFYVFFSLTPFHQYPGNMKI